MANLSTLISSIPSPASSVTTQAFGDAGTVGTAAVYAREDHKHVMPTNANVTGQPITGFTSGAGTVADTDTILQAINKLDGNVGGKQATLLVASTTVTGSAVTTITFSGLDGDAHGGYMVEMLIKNNYAGATNIQCFANNDTTATNYYTETMIGFGTTLAASNGNFAYALVMDQSKEVYAHMTLNTTPSRYFTFKSAYHRGATTTLENNMSMVFKTAALAGNLTRLDFTAGQANAIAVGSIIRIFRRL